MSQGSYPEPKLYAHKTGEDFSSSQYRFVELDGDDKTVVKTGAGERAIGINMTGLSKTDTGLHVEIAYPGGGAKLELGGTVTRGQYIKSGAAGVGVAATADTEEYCARALKSGVSGDIIPVDVVAGIVAG
jgi:hypothetical protein